MWQCRGADHKVEVADDGSGGFETTSLSGEYPANFIIHTNDWYALQKGFKGSFLTRGIIRIENYLINFSQRNDAQSQSFPCQFIEA